MKSVLTKQQAVLQYSLEYEVEGAEDRAVQYGMAGARYRPERLSFTLVSNGTACPQPRDLQVGSYSIYGHKLKKDGTPGQNDTRERPYFMDDLPEWAREIISAALASAREQGDT